ncbi:alpha/beta hydrolase [Pseudodesulfovibrio sediminis]|uniref:Esterase n=1 Tax=Pseudodesulfovibrio sediminis TaxID=2810563 RepID=A0ABM7P4Z3_9BACT|nr:alpha/beta hydrolase [Pseudodesulfovibrio sediminis]BCS87983.1 esterase [Pseudodesulfovibrio sediminis]
MNVYREFANAEDIDREYNAVSMVSDLNAYMAFDSDANETTRNELKCTLDVPYGHNVDETLDIFPAESADAPVVIFIHGGYWKSMSSRDFSLVAKGLVAIGFTVVIPNYSLCPSVVLPIITHQNRAAVAWVYEYIHTFNGDSGNIFICRHSAGAQQVGMLAATDWEGEYRVSKEAIRAGVPISGIFDLSPLYYSWLQPTLRLTHDCILRESALFQLPAGDMPLLVSVGADESSEFIRQAREYQTAAEQAGNSADLYIQEERNHFTTIRDLFFEDGRFTQRLLVFIEQNSR